LPPLVVAPLTPAELPESPYKITDDMSLTEAAAVWERALHDSTPYRSTFDTAAALTSVRKGDILSRLKGVKAGDTQDLEEIADIAAKEIAYLRSQLRIDDTAPPTSIDLKAEKPPPVRATPSLVPVPPVPPISVTTSPQAPVAPSQGQDEPGEQGDPSPMVPVQSGDSRFRFRSIGPGLTIPGDEITP
jgi:hypothetical protein